MSRPMPGPRPDTTATFPSSNIGPSLLLVAVVEAGPDVGPERPDLVAQLVGRT